MPRNFSPEILSLSSYPIPEPSGAGKGGVMANPHILYGGLSLNQNEEPVASERTRVKKTGKAANGRTSTRKRGRPPLFTKDENAIERRRTQIRLAQRAYRSRKEATISSLNGRIAELDTNIEDINMSFKSLHDNIVASELLESRPDLLYNLRSIAEKTTALAQLSKIQTLSESGSSRESETREPGVSMMENSNDQFSSNFGEHSVSGQVPLVTEKTVFGYETIISSTRDRSSKNIEDRDIFENMHSTTVGKVATNIKQPHTAPGGVSYRPRTSTLLHPHPPSTFSFYENSFAGRLRRTCWERGYRLLLDPSTKPEELSRIFRFAFGVTSRKILISRFHKALSQPSDAPEHPDTPFFHIGGAGTHYTYRNQQGDPMSPPSNMYPISKMMGPWPFQQAETPHSENSIDGLLMATGFDGEWFDSNDVESFLREKGIIVDPWSSIVEIPKFGSEFFQTVPNRLSRESNHETMVASEQYGDPALLLEQNDVLDPQLASSSSSSFYSPDGNMMTSIDDGSFSSSTLNNEPNDEDAHFSFPRSPLIPDESLNSPDLSLTFDAGRFIDRLVRKAVCLGRVPGYRRRDVEESLRYAVRFLV